MLILSELHTDDPRMLLGKSNYSGNYAEPSGSYIYNGNSKALK